MSIKSGVSRSLARDEAVIFIASKVDTSQQLEYMRTFVNKMQSSANNYEPLCWRFTDGFACTK